MQIPDVDTLRRRGVVVYGAGRIGKYALNYFKNNDIHVKAVLDRNKNIESILGIPTYNPDTHSLQKDDIVVVCMASEAMYNEIFGTLRQKGVYSIVRSTDIFNENGCGIDENAPENEKKRACAKCIVKGMGENCPKTIQKIGEGIVIRELAILTTTACTLKCENCSARVNEYRNKNIRKDVDLAQFKGCWEKISSAADFIKIVTIAGGEPLLYKELCGLLEILKKDEKIGALHVLTNGTIRPSEKLLHALSDDCIVVSIDDYGDNLDDTLRSKIKDFTDLMESSGINYTTIDNSNGTWHSITKMHGRKRTDEDAAQIFKNCFFNQCLYLMPDLKLEYCGQSGRLRDLGYNIENKDDALDIVKMPKNQMRERLKNYLTIDFISACKYCEGVTKENIVKAGEQSI